MAHRCVLWLDGGSATDCSQAVHSPAASLGCGKAVVRCCRQMTQHTRAKPYIKMPQAVRTERHTRKLRKNRSPQAEADLREQTEGIARFQGRRIWLVPGGERAQRERQFVWKMSSLKTRSSDRNCISVMRIGDMTSQLTSCGRSQHAGSFATEFSTLQSGICQAAPTASR